MEDNLGQPLGGELWWWDYFREEGEVVMYFKHKKHATLFKLTWL
jgi:hypothetical protein